MTSQRRKTNNRGRLTWLGVVLACVCLLMPGLAAAKNDYIELGMQTGHGSLSDPQPDYKMSEFTASFGYHIDDWIKGHLRVNPPGEWDFRISPSFAYITQPDEGVEVSCTAGVKVNTKLGERWYPFLFGATGPLYSTVGVKEEATRLNFGSYMGFGMEYRIDARQGVTVYKLIRHFSNGGVKDPNDGVDTNSWGVSYIWYH